MAGKDSCLAYELQANIKVWHGMAWHLDHRVRVGVDLGDMYLLGLKKIH
jgi:hypothetical protein